MRIAESARQQVSVFRTLFEGPRIMYHGTIASLRVDRMRTVCILRTSIRGASPKDHLERSGSDGHRVLWRRPLFSHARRRGPRTGSTSGWQSHSGAHGNTQETAAENSFAETCKADVSDEASVSLKSHWEEELKKSPAQRPTTIQRCYLNTVYGNSAQNVGWGVRSANAEPVYTESTKALTVITVF
jgi:hypothetical protein